MLECDVSSSFRPQRLPEQHLLFARYVLVSEDMDHLEVDSLLAIVMHSENRNDVALESRVCETSQLIDVKIVSVGKTD